MRECDITASAYNAAATPGVTTAAYARMLLMRDLEILRCDDAYNAAASAAAAAAAAYMTMLMRRQCSISRSYISSAYNAVSAANANIRSRDATNTTTDNKAPMQQCL